jgi:hypothetical protein
MVLAEIVSWSSRMRIASVIAAAGDVSGGLRSSTLVFQWPSSPAACPLVAAQFGDQRDRA